MKRMTTAYSEAGGRAVATVNRPIQPLVHIPAGGSAGVRRAGRHPPQYACARARAQAGGTVFRYPSLLLETDEGPCTKQTGSCGGGQGLHPQADGSSPRFNLT